MHSGARALTAATFAIALLAPAAGLAQGSAATQPEEPVEARGVGISGGIIGGAEVALLVESFIDVKPVWPWIVVPIVTATGGGVGGYYLEQESAGGAIALLVTSMALLIPTTIAISVARAYELPENGAKTVEGDRSDLPSGGAPGEGPPPETETTIEVDGPAGGAAEAPAEAPGEAEAKPGEAEPAPADKPPQPGAQGERGRERRPAGGSLLFVDAEGAARFGLPAVDVRPVALGDASLPGARRTGLEVRVPLLRVELP